MSFKVTFEVLWSRNGDPIKNGILVYQCANAGSRPLHPDKLNSAGVAVTKWDDSWSGDTVKVYCHTDGRNSGTPKYLDTITIKRGATFVLWPD